MGKYVVLLLACLPALLPAAELDCENAVSTLEMNECASLELEAAEREMYRYLETSLEYHSEDTELIEAIQESQAAWEEYARAHCDSVFTLWRDGTIRGLMSISCKTRRTKERTHALWSDFLVPLDDSEPVLPEPN